MEKRRKGVFGPPPGTRCAIFVDDLNMPKKETYGAQPPLELIRLWLDHGGWYELKSKEKLWQKFESMIIVGAMGPPGGGKSVITMRIQRHFNLITYTELGQDSIQIMF
jgi:dynein heavy chain